MMRNEIKNASQIFFYRTNCIKTDAVGSMEIVKQGFIIHLAINPGQKYYGPKNEQAKSRQCLIDVRYKQERQ